MKLQSTLLYFSLFVCSGFSFSAKAQAVNVKDSLALVDLYDSTNGPAWTRHGNWLTGPVKTWYGVTVTGMRVTLVDLSNNGLTGSIPSTIGNLTKTEYLYLSYNPISGSIPPAIGNLTNLIGLYLEGDLLSGAIPNQNRQPC